MGSWRMGLCIGNECHGVPVQQSFVLRICNDSPGKIDQFFPQCSKKITAWEIAAFTIQKIRQTPKGKLCQEVPYWIFSHTGQLSNCCYHDHLGKTQVTVMQHWSNFQIYSFFYTAHSQKSTASVLVKTAKWRSDLVTNDHLINMSNSQDVQRWSKKIVPEKDSKTGWMILQPWSMR